MALNLTITFSNLKRFIPIEPIMCSLNEELNLLCFWCKTGNLYNISVVLKWRGFFLDSLVPDAELKDNTGDKKCCIFNKLQVVFFAEA